ncbi:ATP-binding protein, partial [Acinetobacter baumannii]
GDVAAKSARLSDVKLTTEITPATEVAGNGTELARVFSNLIDNARRYGKTPGTDCAEIHLRSRIEGHQVVVEVFDHGSGVP